MTFISY